MSEQEQAPAPETTTPTENTNQTTQEHPDVNALMREVEEASKAEKEKLLTDIKAVIDAKLDNKKEIANKEIEEMKKKLAEQEAQVKKVEEEAKRKQEEILKEYKDRLANVDKFMSERQSVVPDTGNPYREKPPAELTEQQRKDMFFAALNERGHI